MKRTAVALVAATFLLVPACSGEPRAVQSVQADSTVATSRLIPAYIVSHGWHTGIVVPAKGLNRKIPDLGARFGATAAFYEIGWGDKGFYQAQDITAGLALRALFRSSGAVVHVSALPVSPYESFPESRVVPVCVARGEIDALNEFLSASFSHDPAGRLAPLSKGIYGDSQFYDAAGEYSAANTCNKWTAKGLLSAGFDINPSLKLTAGSVMRYLERHEADRGCDNAPDPDATRQDSPPA